MKHSNKPIEDFCTKFSEETIDPFETKHLKVYLVSALTFLGVCFLSTLGFAWGGMHYNWFTSQLTRQEAPTFKCGEECRVFYSVKDKKDDFWAN